MNFPLKVVETPAVNSQPLNWNESMLYYTRIEGECIQVLRSYWFKWKPSLSGDLQGLRCTCCEHVLGDNPWASAWIVLKGRPRGERNSSARICNACAKKAEKLQDLEECPDCNGDGSGPGWGMEGASVCNTCKGKMVVTKEVAAEYNKKQRRFVLKGW